MDILKVALTALLSAAALFLITKLTGRKQVAQLDFFNYVSGITIGSIAAELATELEEPLRPLIALIVYGLLGIALSQLSDKATRLRKYLNGSPTIVMNNGKLFRENLKKSHLDLSEFLVLCRQAGYFDLGDIQTAVYEYNGSMSFLPVSVRRPATPEDMGLAPQAACVFTEVVMDGRVLGGNLRRMGRDEKWLEKQLAAQNRRAKDVFLALCDDKGRLSVY